MANNKIKVRQIDETELEDFVVTKATAAIVPIQQIYSGNGAPATPPTDQTKGAIYYDIDTFQIYFWNTNTLSW
jgi:hypothetical protein